MDNKEPKVVVTPVIDFKLDELTPKQLAEEEELAEEAKQPEFNVPLTSFFLSR